jgi:hypothetical protein
LKKGLVILFLTILCVSQTGYYFIYKYQLRQAKREMKAELFAKLPESSFELFIAEDNNTIVWKEDGKEFSLGGEMYDVAKIKKENGKTILYCINDKKEKILFQNFAKALKNDLSKNKSGKSSIKFQYTDFTINAPEYNSGAISLPAYTFTLFSSSLSTVHKEINAPPPRV